MDSGQILFIISQLALGAVASFFAIMLWAKTRDVSWMLVVMGTITMYIEIVYSILNMLGIFSGNARIMLAGSVPVVAILLPVIRLSFFIAAFLIMVIKRYRHR